MAVTEDAVIEVLTPGKDYNGTSSLKIPIRVAKRLVAKAAAKAAAASAPMDSETQELMTLYLAAHTYCASDQQLASRSTAGRSGTFTGQTGKGLEATKYGMAALSLDDGGFLQAVTATDAVIVDGFWMGTEEGTVDGLA